MDGDVYDMHGKYIDPNIAGGMRKEALRRAELGPPPLTMFRLWQEENVRSTIKVEELANNESEEDIRREESVVIEEEEEEESYCQGRTIDTMERMEDLVEKMQRLNLKMRSICDEVAKPMVYLLGSEIGPSSVKLARQTLGSTPGSGITFRPPRGQPTFPQAVCTRSKKGNPSSSQEPPSESQPREKESVINVGDKGKEDEEDERLRKEEEEQAAQRAKKRKPEDRSERAAKGEGSRKQKYGVPLEDGLDFEALVDRLLEGHNDLLNLKDILASAPKLREGFKTRLSCRRVVSVRLGDLIPAEAHWAVSGTEMDWKSVGTGSVNLSIKGKPCSGMLDTGAEMNIIKESDALRLGMDIDRMDSGFLYDASGRTPFTGTASNVVIEIGKVKIVSSYGMADPIAVEPLRERIVEDSGEGEVELVYRLPARTKTFRVGEDPMAIESGAYSVDAQARYAADVSFLVNSIVQVHEDGEGSQDPVRDMEEDEFDEGEITDAFRADEYEGVYRELGLLLSCEIREREATKNVLEMRPRFLVRDGHLFIKNEVGNPRRVICGRNRQIDVITALHDGPAGGHRAFALTYAKTLELYYWEGMSEMIRKYCESCVPCQIRASTMYKESLHPRIVRDAGAVVHLDLLAMPQGVGGYNYIFDGRDNLTGFVDGRVIRSKTGETLALCISEYFLRYPFVVEFVMDRGSEFTCGEVRTLLQEYGVQASYTTRAHPQANAPIERVHTTITNLLAKWTNGRENQWPKHLRATFFVENITIKRSTKYAPATLWYGRHATLPIESFLKTWRRQDMESTLSFEELLDLRARQVGIAEERIQEAADRVSDNRLEDKERWDLLLRVRKEPLEVGDVVLLYDSSLEKQWSRKLDKWWLGPYRIRRCGQHRAYEIEKLNCTPWRDWVSGSKLKKFKARD
ncbi:hypothetical protein CBR_g29883 [Chara braunii]|uniref:Integrase catalytic domain-containing protein n=1 Tax=Chara braunii TaxID=69332 RepID=A0A388JWW9_CHABU|nr:hypothetical protein CBR_g29883 [Chara braunii]|eukprot:GBG62275.1 hypothetical protein CBR_g29883 [Chara braunii]